MNSKNLKKHNGMMRRLYREMGSNLSLFLVLGCGGYEHRECYVAGNECREPMPTPRPGKDGATGPAGRDGSSCSVEQLPQGSRVFCTDGSSATILNGQDGSPGVSCSVQPITGGAQIICGIASATILNGTKGADGADGTPAVLELIDPCGKQSSFDEVLLRLGNGQLLAHYADGGKQFLSVITPGNYITTDGTSCLFSVHSDYTVTW